MSFDGWRMESDVNLFNDTCLRWQERAIQWDSKNLKLEKHVKMSETW